MPQSLVALLHHSSRALRRSIEERTRDKALTSTQWRLLVVLGKRGPMRQARLAEVLDIEPISVSRLINRMVQAGWVERAPDPDDRRACLVHPTARAKASLAGLGDVAQAADEAALTGFSADERATLISLLTRLNDNLNGADTTMPAAPDRARK